MTLLVVNLLLALVWVVVTGTFTLPNLLFGFLLAALTLFLIREQTGTATYFRRGGKIAALVVFLLYSVLKAACHVSLAVLKPRLDIRPGVFIYRPKLKTDFEVALLANLVGLTPGTLVFEVSEDRSMMFIHALDCTDPDQLRRDISEGFERRLLELFR